MLHRGRFLGIELKSVTGRLSPAQQLCMEAILRAGGVWAEARSVEDVERILVAFGIPLRGRVVA